MFGWFSAKWAWLLAKGTRQGVIWATMIYLVGALNDVVAKLLGSRLHWIEIAFFRFLFSTVVVLIIIAIGRRNLFRSSIHYLHIARGILGAIALGACCLSVNVMPLAENTTILFSEALFMIPLSAHFLKEKISPLSLVATIIGLCGLIIMFRPRTDNINLLAIIPTIAAFLFAIMNIIIKKMIDMKENTLTMLFYFGIYTTILSGIIVPFYWTTPNAEEVLYISILGIGANVIQLFIFLAYRATTASTISPVRYIELPFAILFGFIFFDQIPKYTALIGAGLIIIGTIISSFCGRQRS
ncbi:MAG: DMT family transporter [Holosporales bacterium]|jgi:S-adenosylmethionine uptake transporter|nr:DMT family transporter [Holosporales bacterium]